MAAYYNEIDPYAAQWLRNLIDAGHIAPGIVDERSIEDVYPSDLRGFTQCHFFAGIGVWSYALRSAGWSDDRPVWTGSCPCQPFSKTGKGAGFDDERHLWPAFHHLIRECKPGKLVGEQVADKDALPWLDLVQDDLEALGYAFGAVAFPAASVGSPNLRGRTYWMADSDSARLERRGRYSLQRGNQRLARSSRVAGGMANTYCIAGEQGGPEHGGRDQGGDAQPRPRPGGSGVPGGACGPVNGFWASADWLSCRDGKWRPVEPGTFPLAHGAPARVGRLRAYGNAINAEAARVFIEAVMASEQDTP